MRLTLISCLCLLSLSITGFAQDSIQYVAPVVKLIHVEKWHSILDYSMSFSYAGVKLYAYNDSDKIRMYISCDVIDRSKLGDSLKISSITDTYQNEIHHLGFRNSKVFIGAFSGIRLFEKIQKEDARPNDYNGSVGYPDKESLLKYMLNTSYKNKFIVEINFEAPIHDSTFLDKEVKNLIENCTLISPAEMDRAEGYPYTSHSIDSIMSAEAVMASHLIDTVNLARMDSIEYGTMLREMRIYGYDDTSGIRNDEALKKFIKENVLPGELANSRKELDTLVTLHYSNTRFFNLKYDLINGLKPLNDYLDNYYGEAKPSDIYWFEHQLGDPNSAEYVLKGMEKCLAKTIYKDTIHVSINHSSKMTIGNDTTLWFIFNNEKNNHNYVSPVCFIKKANSWIPVVEVLDLPAPLNDRWEFDNSDDSATDYILFHEETLKAVLLGTKSSHHQKWAWYEFNDSTRKNYAVTYLHCPISDAGNWQLGYSYEYNENHEKFKALKKVAPYKEFPEEPANIKPGDNYTKHAWQKEIKAINKYNDSIRTVRRNIIDDEAEKLTAKDKLYITDIYKVDLLHNGRKQYVSIIVANGTLLNYHCFSIINGTVTDVRNEDTKKAILDFPFFKKYIEATAKNLKEVEDYHGKM